MSLRYRFLISMLVPFLFIYVMITYITARTALNELQAQYNSRALEALSMAAKEVSHHFEHVVDNLEMFTSIAPPSEKTSKEVAVGFENFIQHLPQVVRLSAINEYGEEYVRIHQFAGESQQKDMASLYNSPVYIRPMLDFQTYFGNLQGMQGHTYQVIDVAVPVRNRDTGAATGVVWGKVSFQQIQVALEQYVPKGGVIALVLNEDASSTAAFASRSQFDYSDDISGLVQIINNNRSVSGIFHHDTHQNSIAAYTTIYLYGMKFSLIYLQPEREIYSLAERVSRYHLTVMLVGIVLLTIVIIVVSITITRPVQQTTEQMIALAMQYRVDSAESDILLPMNSVDELSSLRGAMSVLQERIQFYSSELTRLNHELESKVEMKTGELEELNTHLKQLNEHLEERVREEVAGSRKKDHIMIQQSRLAAMGEMIGAIAHQWRQPLNTIALYVQDMEDALEFGELSESYVRDSVTRVMEQIAFMSRTIDDFRNYFRPSREKTVFSVVDATREILRLTETQRYANGIAVALYISTEDSSYMVAGYPNEFKQVIVNLLSNSRDAIVTRSYQSGVAVSGCINIRISRCGSHFSIEVEDDGGGIPEEDLFRVFEPYFSTKEEGKGAGIGLYMSKMIIEESMGGKLRVKNGGSGAVFTIELPIG